MVGLATAGAGASADAASLSAKATRSGPEARVQLTATARSASRCTATVSAAGQRSLRLPTLVTRRRAAAWRWIAPPGAPRGRWHFSARCSVRGSTSRARTSLRVPVERSTEKAGFVFPGTLTATKGRFLKRPRSQAIAVDPNGSRGAEGDGNPGEAGYCTWGAWNLAKWLGSAVYGPAGRNHAKYWADNAARNGLPTGTEPRPGAVFVKTDGYYGHVGVVKEVLDSATFITTEMNGGRVIAGTDFKTTEFGQYHEHRRTTGPNIRFIYQPGTQPGAYVGHIVQWDGDTKKQKTAWLVGQDGKRRWIPTSALFYCLKGHGVPGPDVLPAAKLDEYPDLTGQWVTCGPSGFGAGSGDPPGETQPPDVPSPPPPRTWNETVGGNANTWTNHTNAGGTQGPTIPARTTVAVSCKLQGFRVENGNPWWYRIASEPWSNQYYVSADAFYNNGQTSGPLKGTPYVDPAVADC